MALHKAQALGCDAPVKLRAAGAAVTGGLLRPEEPVMAGGFPLSRQAAQPERILRPPHPSNTRRHQAPHDLQPQPLAAATFSPASARSQ